MADTKITALTALTAADPINDVCPIVDVSDTTMAASGTTKKISINNILGCSGTATLASATITGDLTVDTSTLKVDSTNDRVGVGTATPGGSLEVYKNTNGQNRLFLNNPSTGAAAYNSIDFTAGTASNQILSVGSGYSGSFPYSTGALVIRSGQVNGMVLTTGGSAAGIQFGINDTLAMTLNSTGLNIANGNVILGTSGKGIDFSAVTGGTGTATGNVLNDYEEGTWTPTVEGTSTTGSATYSTQIARYTKVGRLVTFNLRVIYTGGTGFGNLRVAGLPFTTGFGANYAIYSENIALTAGYIAVSSSASSVTSIGIDQIPTGGGGALGVPYDAAGDIQISGSYTV